MGKDYNEIICTAIDEIVTARLQGLQYDITKLCTIIDDTSSYEGKYTVSDGSIRFEAYSTNTSYKNGNNVLVIIPNGDYNMQKTISGRVAATDTTPFNYVSPMDTMVKITNNIFDDTKVILGNNNGLLANDNGKSSVIGPIYSISESGNLTGFTRLGITADFRSWLTGLDVVTGTYGIKILIYTDILNAPGSMQNNAVYELTFSSTDMIGNPYQFESYFYQEQVFDISMINNINKIDVYFYQDGKFTDGNGDFIPWQYEDSLFGLTKMPANLFVNNVKLYLGYESDKFTDETLMLCTSDSLSYHYTQYQPHTNTDLVKTISLRWINKVAENEFRLLDGSNLEDNFEVRWFRYNIGYETIDQYAGKDWERVYPTGENAFIYKFSPNIKQQFEQIKVIGLISEVILQDEETLNDNQDYQKDLLSLQNKYIAIENYEEDPNYLQELAILREKYLTLITTKPYYSNLLIFENEEKVPDAITVDASKALSIVCMDNSEGNYFLYDQNGQIIDEGQGQGYLRTVEARYYGAPINESLGKIDYLRWYFPDEIHGGNAYTMILNDLPVTEIADYYGIDYVMSERGTNHIDAITGNLNTAQTYSIKNYFNLTDANNTIRCILSINGVEYEATKEFLFGKAGTNGSNATFVLNFMDNKDALVAADGEEVAVKVQLYDVNNSRVGFTAEQAKKITWSWFKAPDHPFMEIINNTDNATVTLKYIPDQEGVIRPWNKNYHILKASYNYNGISLEAYLPVPIKRDNKYTQFEGAKSVIYDHSGTPTYYPKEYKLHEYIDEKHYEIEGLNWELIYDDETDAMTQSLIPKLKDSNSKPGYKALSASTFFASGFNDKVCVSCSKDGNVLWSQPILIMQSQYDFAMLNSWDGSLTIDEENGTILSTMLGAGRKNKDNTFSGVLIGDIQQGTDLNNANNMTGVYGYHHGIQSYSLKEDGTATFGKAGRGQILIDGNDSIIKSASYDSAESNGMMIDLDDGIIDIKNNNQKRIDIRSELTENNPYYLQINGIGEIPLIGIGEKDYYLSSYSYWTNENKYGTYFDLDKGSLSITGNAGSVFLSSSDNPQDDLFRIKYKSTDIHLIKMGNADYYLQSYGYTGQKIKTVNQGGNIYELYKNSKTSIQNGMNNTSISSVVGYNKNNIYQTTKNADGSYTIGNLVPFYATTITVVLGEDANGKDIKTEIAYTGDEYKQYFISALVPLMDSTIPSGLKIDLNSGLIDGYNLYLRGTNPDNSSKTFILDSTAKLTPFIVGEKFKVNWDGTLYCENIQYLGTKPDSGKYVININENFTVTSSGGVSGKSGWFGGGWFGGNAQHALTADYATKSGQSGWASYALELKQGAPYADSFTAAEGLQALKDIEALKAFKKAVDFVLAPPGGTALLTRVANLEGAMNSHTHKYKDYHNIITGGYVERTSANRKGNYPG